jgi:putative methyltransferase (TIGR04325 family)
MNQITYQLINNPPLSLIFKARCLGVYPSFEAARAAIPAGCRTNYNQEEGEQFYRGYPTTRVRPSDYPVLLHLRNLVKPGGRLIDLGGNNGMACYTALRYYPLPDGFEWTLCDLPNIIELARETAEREGDKSKHLRFTSDLREAGVCDIFLSSGCLQEIEAPLADLLRLLPQLPTSVIINRIPVWGREAIVTLRMPGSYLFPYKYFSRKAFVESVEQLGYQLIDDWDCPESSTSIRFNRHLRINQFHGFYFARTS